MFKHILYDLYLTISNIVHFGTKHSRIRIYFSIFFLEECSKGMEINLLARL